LSCRCQKVTEPNDTLTTAPSAVVCTEVVTDLMDHCATCLLRELRLGEKDRAQRVDGWLGGRTIDHERQRSPEPGTQLVLASGCCGYRGGQAGDPEEEGEREREITH